MSWPFRWMHARSVAALLPSWAACRRGTRLARAFCTVLVLTWASVSQAGKLPEDDPTSAEGLPREVQGIDLEDSRGRMVPLDVRLRTHDGHDGSLGDHLSTGTPLIVVMAYYSCPMLCTLVLNGLLEGVKSLAWNAGKEFRVLTVSIDPRDTTEIASAKRSNYLADYGRPVPEGGWTFATTSESEVRRLAGALGFLYRWDEPTQQYVHPAAAFVLTPSGKVSQVLSGIRFPERDLRLSLIEASEGNVGSAVDQLLLFCFHYVPREGKYVLAAGRLMRASGALSVGLLAIWLARLWRRERTKVSAVAT